jgi:23S rRNA (adenine2503-C2)-methyltransferase
MNELKDIRSYSDEELTNIIVGLGEPKFRGKQIHEWIWKKGATDFEAMKNIPKSLIEGLKEKYTFRNVTIDKTQVSEDGTIKSRLRLHDNNFVEAVLIPVAFDDRYTVCISCQVGCSLTCKFCATGKMGRIRNLEPSEIYDQVRIVNQQCMETYNHPITNIVYMGMGEPLLTYNSVIESVALITGKEGLGISPKRITVSTAGISKMIKKLADDNVKFNLAISLHAADDFKRNEIMPINESNNLKSLVAALDYFYKKTKNRITFEYITFRGFNDTIEDAENLVKICRRIPAKVNIIEYNPIGDGMYEKSEEDQIDLFANYLKKNKVNVSVRKSRGKDIDAACGQLANKN